MIEIDRVDFVSIPSQDIERSKRFYGDLLGLEAEVETDTGVEFRAGQVTLGVWEPERWGREFVPNTGYEIALRVPDVVQARVALEGAGVPFFGETRESSVCLMATFADPDGNKLMLHRRHDAD